MSETSRAQAAVPTKCYQVIALFTSHPKWNNLYSQNLFVISGKELPPLPSPTEKNFKKHCCPLKLLLFENSGFHLQTAAARKGKKKKKGRKKKLSTYCKSKRVSRRISST